jgi:hypothetical protein
LNPSQTFNIIPLVPTRNSLCSGKEGYLKSFGTSGKYLLHMTECKISEPIDFSYIPQNSLNVGDGRSPKVFGSEQWRSEIIFRICFPL